MEKRIQITKQKLAIIFLAHLQKGELSPESIERIISDSTKVIDYGSYGPTLPVSSLEKLVQLELYSREACLPTFMELTNKINEVRK
jgi:hypothetical protein